MPTTATGSDHPDRPRLLDAFTTSAQQADAIFGKRLDDPATLRQHFDAACNQIVSALRAPGGAWPITRYSDAGAVLSSLELKIIHFDRRITESAKRHQRLAVLIDNL